MKNNKQEPTLLLFIMSAVSENMQRFCRGDSNTNFK